MVRMRGKRKESEKGKGIGKPKTQFQLRNSPFRGVAVGERRAGVESVGEFSFSSLKLKLFL